MTLPMNIFQVMQRLPHRYPFLLIDRVIEVDLPNKRLKAVKNITINKPFFNGHFPYRPIFPGVLILEEMSQASSLLHSYPGTDNGPDTENLYYFAGIDNARFKRPIIPGDQVIIEVIAERDRGGIYKYHATATVDGELACETDLMCAVRKIED